MDTLDRRQVAAMMADVVGFTAMPAADEEATRASLRAHRGAVVVVNNGGRIVKTLDRQTIC